MGRSGCSFSSVGTSDLVKSSFSSFRSERSLSVEIAAAAPVSMEHCDLDSGRHTARHSRRDHSTYSPYKTRKGERKALMGSGRSGERRRSFHLPAINSASFIEQNKCPSSPCSSLVSPCAKLTSMNLTSPPCSPLTCKNTDQVHSQPSCPLCLDKDAYAWNKHMTSKIGSKHSKRRADLAGDSTKSHELLPRPVPLRQFSEDCSSHRRQQKDAEDSTHSAVGWRSAQPPRPTTPIPAAPAVSPTSPVPATAMSEVCRMNPLLFRHAGLNPQEAQKFPFVEQRWQMQELLRVDFDQPNWEEGVSSVVVSGLQFLQDLHDYGQCLELPEWRIFQELLQIGRVCLPGSAKPRGSQTTIKSHSVMHSPIPSKPNSSVAALYEVLTDAEICSLMKAACQLRTSLRVKLEDDNDLQLARTALSECALYLRNLHDSEAASANPGEKPVRKTYRQGLDYMCGKENIP